MSKKPQLRKRGEKKYSTTESENTSYNESSENYSYSITEDSTASDIKVSDDSNDSNKEIENSNNNSSMISNTSSNIIDTNNSSEDNSSSSEVTDDSSRDSSNSNKNSSSDSEENTDVSSEDETSTNMEVSESTMGKYRDMTESEIYKDYAGLDQTEGGEHYIVGSIFIPIDDPDKKEDELKKMIKDDKNYFISTTINYILQKSNIIGETVSYKVALLTYYFLQDHFKIISENYSSILLRQELLSNYFIQKYFMLAYDVLYSKPLEIIPKNVNIIENGKKRKMDAEQYILNNELTIENIKNMNNANKNDIMNIINRLIVDPDSNLRIKQKEKEKQKNKKR